MRLALPNKYKITLLLIALTLLQYFFNPGISHVIADAKLILPAPHEFFRTRPVVVVLCWLAGTWGLLTLLIQKNVYWRVLSWALFLITLSLNYASQEVTQSPFNVNQYDLALGEINHAGSFIKSYWHLIKQSLLYSFGVWGGFWILYKILKPNPLAKTWLFLLLALVGTTVNLMRYKATRNVVPSFFAIPGSILYKHLTNTYYGPRDPLTVDPRHSALVDHIIVIIDESIRQEYLTINNAAMKTTPYLATTDVLNYGSAISAGNSSRHSNLTIRTGLTQAQIPDHSFLSYRKPNIYQFAQRAGFFTAYANAQRAGENNFDNFMNQFDLDYIQSFKNVLHVSKNEKCGDEALVDFITTEVSAHPKSLVFVNKMGAHFPYRERYPESAKRFTPDLAVGESQYDAERTHNTYMNAIYWSVDRFFEELLPKLSGQNYIIIYVSDHGERIEVAHRASGHGSLFNAPKEEASIPFLIFTSNHILRHKLLQFLNTKKNHATHFDIFPTILFLLGYDKSWVKHQFGPGLFDHETQPQMFYSGSIHHTGQWNQFIREKSCVQTSH